MKRPTLLLNLIFLLNIAEAQTISFDFANPQPDLIQVYAGSIATGDIDGDGDADLMISGLDPGRQTALYLNDGIGNFTEAAETPFPEASDTSTILADLDGDGDLDLYFSGFGFGVQEFAHIYLNDGNGNFTQLSNPDLVGFRGAGGAAIADVDGDGDPDLITSAENSNGEIFADVYLNNGDAVFSSSGTDITPVRLASIAFLDSDGDGDQDVLISGELENESASTALYLNDGSGNFNADAANNFVQMKASDLDVADIDGDGDVDLLISGLADSEIRSIIYVNDGSGIFSELENVNLQDVFGGSNAFSDLDNDGDQDIITTGSQDGGLPNIYNIVYENLGGNIFAPTDTLGGDYISSCVAEDFNGDDLADIVIIGFVDDTSVYWNNSVITSITDNYTSKNITVYPNPTRGQLKIRCEEGIIDEIRILDLSGRVIESLSGELLQSTINMNSLNGGVYWVRVRLEDGSYSQSRVILE